MVYFLTSASGLTWRHGGNDGGDLATAVTLDGVPHPTGYPLYLLTGKLLLFLAPDPARALALVSALWGALAAGVFSLAVYRFNRQLLSHFSTSSVRPLLREIDHLSGGLLAGLSLAFAPLVWSQSIIIEIYSLNVLLLASLFLALEWWWEKPANVGRIYLLAIVAGLAVGHHRTAIFSLLAVTVFLYLTGRTRNNFNFLTWKRLVLVTVLLGLAAGLPSLILLSRGGQNPASNWDDLSWSNPSVFYK